MWYLIRRLKLGLSHRPEHRTRQTHHHVVQRTLVAEIGRKHRRLQRKGVQFRTAVGHTLLGSRAFGGLHWHQQDEEISTSFRFIDPPPVFRPFLGWRIARWLAQHADG
ncbi:VOC family protein [Accumulibacter sp.]|uniref:VOC family protein n=1 Tax=Accumulibacter sp. TaxID=2053492 RepID=UPI00338E2C63